MEAMSGNDLICHQEFRMYPSMLRHFAHVLRDEYGLTSSQQDLYEKVEVLYVVVALSKHTIRPAWNYNDGVEPPKSNPNKHPLFQNCIRAIDGTHVRVVLPRHERVNFIGRKGVLTQNVLIVYDFNLCFMFVLVGYTGNTHDRRILARAIFSPKIDFSHLAPGKYYLMDFSFAHQPRFRNARERFNFRHSSCRNVIECAFGVLKQRWKILDRMPSYSFETQVVVVLATMGIQDFVRCTKVLDEAFA
ncbi:uncharacterized protein LOC111378270 [Olea europaea var. sylvestris]|uniref:uncharacterized protein LOC111378270 n=1 Tax=Olea europaea var. sylvestris TaxID=158386 RepID=UPI000C1CE771|nr:uncharacterized protein LOC111378270 [Olea europaea var. sylvestris]